MNIKNELIEIKHHFLKWVVVFFVVTVLFFAVPVSFPNQEQSSDSFLIKSSQEDKKSLASHFFIKIKKDLLQSNVELISTSPIAIFIVQIKIAGLLAFLLTLPYLLYCFFMYLTPALLSREKKVFFLTSFSFAMLFLTGVIFSYVFLVPQMFRALLGFSQSFELTPYLAVDEFISWTVTSLFITGALFLLPMVMYMLTVCGIASASFWKRHWRVAFMVFVIIASVITPDVSGVGVLLLSLPGTGLYVLGISLSSFHTSSTAPVKVRTRRVATSPDTNNKKVVAKTSSKKI